MSQLKEFVSPRLSLYEVPTKQVDYEIKMAAGCKVWKRHSVLLSGPFPGTTASLKRKK